MIVLLIVTLTSMLLAAVTSTIAWRLSGEERRRSEARIAALSAEIHESIPVPVPRTADLFVLAAPRSGTRTFGVLAGGAVVFAVAMAILVSASFRQSHPAQPPVVTPAARPLELVALGHERLGDQLTVRGVVRNPAAGAEMDRLTAVVVLVSPDGELVDSGRTAVDASALKPGGESAFVVTMPRAGAVGRYRVSFHTDGRVVSHVDRRHEPS